MQMKVIIAVLLMFAVPVVSYSADNTTTNNQQTTTTEKKPLYWVDPMEPDIHYSAPGKSRMGMELVPVYSKKKAQ